MHEDCGHSDFNIFRKTGMGPHNQVKLDTVVLGQLKVRVVNWIQAVHAVCQIVHGMP